MAPKLYNKFKTRKPVAKNNKLVIRNNRKIQVQNFSYKNFLAMDKGM